MSSATSNCTILIDRPWSLPPVPTLKTKTAVGYVRLSDRAARGDAVSLERQRAEIAAWCERNGLRLVNVHEDVGISGRKLHRAGLDAAMAECVARGAVLVSYSLDRIARSAAVLDRLKADRIPFRVLDFPEISEIMLDVLLFTNSMYSRMISSKMRAYHADRKARAARGETTPHPTPKPAPNVDKARETVVGARAAHSAKATARSRFIWGIVEPLTKAGRSTRAIAAELNAQGFVTPRGKPWNHVGVARIIDRFSPVTVS